MSAIDQGISSVRSDWLYRPSDVQEDLGLYNQQDTPSKILSTQGRRAERRFTAIPSSTPMTNKERVRSQGKVQSVNPSSLWPKTQQQQGANNVAAPSVSIPTQANISYTSPSSSSSSENWMPRQPSKITTTKPDLDLLFSLFAVIETEGKENDSELETSLSPHSSPNISHLNYPVIPSQDALSQYTYQQVDPCSSSSPQQVYMSESLSPSSYVTDEDYPATLEHDIVNTCDGMTWLPPVFDNKLMEKAVPFSELVDVFCM